MLEDRGMLELSFEALVVARTERLPSNVVETARSVIGSTPECAP